MHNSSCFPHTTHTAQKWKVCRKQEEFLMKATGIVRRIDDLGRVVVPKEIRRTLRIREGDHSLITLLDIDKNRAFVESFIRLSQRVGAKI